MAAKMFKVKLVKSPIRRQGWNTSQPSRVSA